MPYYKKKLFFLESVNSALNQTYKNTEIIIIYDDIDLSDFEYIYEITKLDINRIYRFIDKYTYCDM